MRFRKREQTVNGKKTGEFDLDEEELTDFYDRLIMMLRNEQEAGDLSRDERSVLVELLKKSMLRVFEKDAKLGKEVEKMTEPLMELEIDKYIVMLRNAETERDEMEANLNRAEAERDELKRQTKSKRELFAPRLPENSPKREGLS